jgi:pimeloyl-ACP methyl ester carboxylesterase
MPFLTAAGHKLEYEWHEAADADKPALVFLHEGLGSIRQWRDFPLRVAQATGCPALVYSRYGYGHSDVLEEPRRSVRFMHEEALEALPAVPRPESARRSWSGIPTARRSRSSTPAPATRCARWR